MIIPSNSATLLLLLPFALASCATPSAPTASSAAGKETYRYVNTLDVRKDNTLDQVKVIGYDEGGIQEATRLEVSVGTASLSLKDAAGDENAMYNPSVELGTDGALIVSWGQIGDTTCRAEIVADASGKLVERKRVCK